MSRRKLSRIFKTYSVERAWKAIADRLQWSHYMNKVDDETKIRNRRQRTDMGKYSFVNRTIQHWNQLPAEALGTIPSKTIIFKKRVIKVIIFLISELYRSMYCLCRLCFSMYCWCVNV